MQKKMLTILVLLLLLFSSFPRPNMQPVSAVKNDMVEGTKPVVVDGNLSSFDGEWTEDDMYSITLKKGAAEKYDATFWIKYYNDTLYFALNFTKEGSFAPLDITNTTKEHDWFTIIFDRNFDGNLFGSNESYDDIVFINYNVANTSSDGLAKYPEANKTGFVNVTLDTLVGGINNGNAVLKVTNTTDNVTYVIEASKPIRSGDEAGGDINYIPTDVAYVRVAYWENHTTEFNFTESYKTPNFLNFWIKPPDEPYSETNPENVTVVIDYAHTYENESNFEAIYNLLSAYGFKVLKHSTGKISFDTHLKDADVLIILGADKQFESEEIEDILRFMKLSRGVFIAADENATLQGNLNNITREVGITYLNGSLLYKDNNTSFIGLNNLNLVDYYTKTSPLTSRTISKLNYVGTVLNLTSYTRNDLLNLDENATDYPHILKEQDFDIYSLIDMSDDWYVDLDDDEALDPGLENTTSGLSLLTALELQFGARALFAGTYKIFNDTQMDLSTRMFLLKSVEWLGKMHMVLHVNNITASSLEDKYLNESLNISATIFKGNKSLLAETSEVYLVVLRTGYELFRIKMTENPDNASQYFASLTLNYTGYLEILIQVHEKYYGFVRSESVFVFVTESPLVPRAVDPVFAVAFALTIATLVIFAFLYKKKINV